MRLRCFLIVPAALLVLCGATSFAAAQDSPSKSDRKILRQTTPNYPDIARRMGLTGTVRVMAVVSPDGKVKKVEAVGGSPILVQVTQDAVYQWKFAPASAESREIIELHFNPSSQ